MEIIEKMGLPIKLKEEEVRKIIEGDVDGVNVLTQEVSEYGTYYKLFNVLVKAKGRHFCLYYVQSLNGKNRYNVTGDCNEVFQFKNPNGSFCYKDKYGDILITDEF